MVVKTLVFSKGLNFTNDTVVLRHLTLRHFITGFDKVIIISMNSIDNRVSMNALSALYCAGAFIRSRLFIGFTPPLLKDLTY